MDRDTLIIAVVLTWCVLTGINAVIAKAKNLHVPGVIVASLVLSPLVAWLYAAGMPKMDERATSNPYPYQSYAGEP